MPFFTFGEIFDIVLMTAIVGFIFSGIFQKPKTYDYDPLRQMQFSLGRINVNWEDFKFAAMVTAPAIILHEFGHKFVALAYGMQATFQAAYTFLALGVVLKVLNFPFIFFVPAFVSISGLGTPWMFSLIAFAGPGVNLVLWLGSLALLKQRKLSQKWHAILFLTSRINMFLFIFNMLPLPGFDGSKVFLGLIDTLT